MPGPRQPRRGRNPGAEGGPGPGGSRIPGLFPAGARREKLRVGMRGSLSPAALLTCN